MKQPIDEIDTQGTPEIVCPFCGYVFDDSWEYNGDDMVECDCGKKFNLYSEYTVEYYTCKPDWLKEWRRHNRLTLLDKGMYSELRALGR